jgi:hypothetical protein
MIDKRLINFGPNDPVRKMLQSVVDKMKQHDKEQEQLDKLIALGVDLMVSGECPFCPLEKPCNSPYCPYTPEEKK